MQTAVTLRRGGSDPCPSQGPFFTPPNFAPGGRDRPGETLVGMAVSRRLLARRKSEVQHLTSTPPYDQSNDQNLWMALGEVT